MPLCYAHQTLNPGSRGYNSRSPIYNTFYIPRSPPYSFGYLVVNSRRFLSPFKLVGISPSSSRIVMSPNAEPVTAPHLLLASSRSYLVSPLEIGSQGISRYCERVYRSGNITDRGWRAVNSSSYDIYCRYSSPQLSYPTYHHQFGRFVFNFGSDLEVRHTHFGGGDSPVCLPLFSVRRLDFSIVRSGNADSILSSYVRCGVKFGTQAYDPSSTDNPSSSDFDFFVSGAGDYSLDCDKPFSSFSEIAFHLWGDNESSVSSLDYRTGTSFTLSSVNLLIESQPVADPIVPLSGPVFTAPSSP